MYANLVERVAVDRRIVGVHLEAVLAGRRQEAVHLGLRVAHSAREERALERRVVHRRRGARAAEVLELTHEAHRTVDRELELEVACMQQLAYAGLYYLYVYTCREKEERRAVPASATSLFARRSGCSW